MDGQRLDNILDSLSLRPDNTVVYDGEKYAKISVPAAIGSNDTWFKYEPIM
ncbi:MAG: hypothetical protein MJ246_01975 [Clostridia bacterium]|nr:hypothetical protein [Clostridia bacterium]